jgi:histone H1/5
VPQEAITQHREDARSGVSRSAIKKASLAEYGSFRVIDVSLQYAEEKYKLDMSSASNLHQLNLALTRGAEKETFVFPKGPSGKVKLAPKRPRAPADTKEVYSYCALSR